MIRDISNFQVSVPCVHQPKIHLENKAPFPVLFSDSQKHLLIFLSGLEHCRDLTSIDQQQKWKSSNLSAPLYANPDILLK